MLPRPFANASLMESRVWLLIVFQIAFFSPKFEARKGGWEIVSKLLLFIESEFLWKHFHAKHNFFPLGESNLRRNIARGTTDPGIASIT